MSLDYKFISELDESDKIGSSDCFLLTKIGTDSDNVSKKVQYSTLSSNLISQLSDNVSSLVDMCAQKLSSQVFQNKDDILSLSVNLHETDRAVIKMANCIQTSKCDISALSSYVYSEVRGLSGVNGVLVDKSRASSDGILIGHSNSIRKVDPLEVRKISYDSYGHVTSSEVMTSSDIVKLVNFDQYVDGKILLSGAGVGLYIEDKKVCLSVASTDSIGGVKVNGNNVSISEDGILSAADTKYSIANREDLGLIRVDPYAELEEKCYPVKLDPDTAVAYVSVDWSGTTITAENTYTVDQYHTISSVAVIKGELQTPGKSTFLYDTLSSLSDDVYQLSSDVDQLNIKKLSADYVGFSNGQSTASLELTNDTYLMLKHANEQHSNSIAEVNLRSLIPSGISQMSVVTEIQAGEFSIPGLFLQVKQDSVSYPTINCDLFPITADKIYLSSEGPLSTVTIYDMLMDLISRVNPPA